MDINGRTFEAVKAVIVETLGIENRAGALKMSTPLFGSMPELDSFAVVELITVLEERFEFQIEGDEFTGEIFETVGSLVEFVVKKTSHRNDAVLPTELIK
ncbi:MAG: acyl carrier protein [Bradyrhizobium sp.]|nr:acyl carrier protein [Bradyrhizobium sp.]